MAADLIRIYRVRHGNYKGEHKFYATRGKFEEDFPGVTLIQWPHIDIDTLKPGNWVEAEDGWILQVLNVYPMPKPKSWVGEFKHRSWIVRFANIGFIVMRKQDGTLKVPYLYGAYTMPNKNSGADEGRVMRSNDKQKAMWIEMVIQGIDPVEAYKICFKPKRQLTRMQYIHLTVRLIRDKLVKDAIMGYISKLTKHITKVVTPENFAQRILDYYEETGKKPGSADDLKGIRLMKDVLTAVDKIPSREGEEIEEADYTEEDIPQLN